MSLLDNKHIHHFFINKEINELYIAVALKTFAVSLISIFVPIYFYQLGFSIPQIIFYFMLLSAAFLVVTPLSTKVVSRVGVKHSMLLSMPFLIMYYAGLIALGKYAALFFILPFFFSLHTSLYNFGYHLNFIEHADKKAQGREIAFLRIVSNMMAFVSPFAGALIITFFGFRWIYLIGSGLMLMAMAPLFLTKDVFEQIDFSAKDVIRFLVSKKNRWVNASLVGYAIESRIGMILWPIFLLIILNNLTMVGGLYSLTFLVSLIAIYWVGKKTDKASKKVLIRRGTLLHSLGWIGRLFVYNPLTVFLVDSFKNIAQAVLHIPWTSFSYDLAKKQNYFEFIVAREIIFSFSRVVLLPFIVLLFYYLGSPFKLVFVLAAVSSLFYATITRA